MSVQFPNPKNKDILIFVGDRLYHRDEAKISVFDSVVQGGDAVWEGMRVYDGRVFKFREHIDRLFASAHALCFENIPSREEIRQALFATLEANGMRDGVHIRLTLTRGRKVTSGMSPHWNQYGCTLIIIAEWKPPVFDSAGIRVITSAIRRNNPQFLDSKIHHTNLLNNILAKIQANNAGVDEAVMLDSNGFIAETNATNLFIVQKGIVITPHADACLHGITRAMVIELCKENAIPILERNISLTELYTADEAFTSGSMGELTPIVEADKRKIAGGASGPVTRRLQALHKAAARIDGEPLPF